MSLSLISMAYAPVAKADDPYLWDVGVAMGMSGYIGDVNESNPFRRPGFEFGAIVRYNFNERWAVRGQMSALTLSGNTADFESVYPGNVEYSFSSTLYDLTFRGECNFLPYGIGESYRMLSRWTPYVAAGIGVSMASAGSSTSVAPVLPLCVGVKYKPARRLNMAVEFSMAKVFGDRIDGKNLDDLYGIKSSFIKNTDWYSALSLSVTYEFGQKCAVCNRID